MNFPLILAVVALFFGLAAEWEANGRSLAGWGVCALAGSLLWAHLA